MKNFSELSFRCRLDQWKYFNTKVFLIYGTNISGWLSLIFSIIPHREHDCSIPHKWRNSIPRFWDDSYLLQARRSKPPRYSVSSSLWVYSSLPTHAPVPTHQGVLLWRRIMPQVLVLINERGGTFKTLWEFIIFSPTETHNLFTCSNQNHWVVFWPTCMFI